MKPKIQFVCGLWLCGGTFTSPWYIDWFSGKTPTEAYLNWEKGIKQ